MAMYSCRDDNQRKQINAFMTAFQEHPQAWSRVDTILEQTKCDQSKFFVSSVCHLAVAADLVIFFFSLGRGGLLVGTDLVELEWEPHEMMRLWSPSHDVCKCPGSRYFGDVRETAVEGVAAGSARGHQDVHRERHSPVRIYLRKELRTCSFSVHCVHLLSLTSYCPARHRS